LLSFNGKPVRSVKELQLLVASSPVGRSVSLEVLREGTRLTLEAVLVARDETAQSAERAQTGAATPWLGMTFEETGQGVRVKSVEPGSAAEGGDLREGDIVLAINRQAIRTMADLNAARRAARGKDSVLLLLRRGEANLFVALPAD
jgi:serine protease Do/serine protease DegQ